MLDALSSAVVRHAKKIVVFAVLLAVAAGFYGSGVARALAPGGFEVREGEAQEVARIVEEKFGQGAPDLIALVSGMSVEGGEAPAQLIELVTKLQAHPAVAFVASPLGPGGAALTSNDRDTAMLAITLRGDARTKEMAYDSIANLLHEAPVSAELGGPLAVAVVGQQTAEHDLVRAELVAFPLVALLLALFFGGRVAMLLPLVVGGLAIVFATAMLRGLAGIGNISVFALNIVTLLGLGLAIDYSLFMVQRFREELPFGTVHEAVVRTVTSAGKTMLFSGVAVAVSLLALLVFPIALMHSIAIAGALIVTLTVLASLVVLPAMLAWMGPRVDWPRRPAEVGHTPEGRGWARLAQIVMRRPGLFAMGTTALLVVVGAPMLRLETELSDARIFPASFEVRSVQERLEAPEGFAMAHTVQYAVVIEGETESWQGAQLERLHGTHAALSAIPGVVRVDSYAGFPRPDLVHGDTTLVQVVAEKPHDASGRAAQVDALHSATAGWRSAKVGGAPAVAHEVDTALEGGGVPAAVIVVVVTLIVLTLAFGAIVVAFKAVIMNVLSLSASFGALVWIFQDGRLEGLLGYQTTGSIDPLVLLVMFAIVFGLSMDYELFLLSRIREDYSESGDARESVARGLAATGRLITMAGLMLIVVLVGFASADVLFVKHLGVGMAIAVAVDATIVRGLLVPATMRLLGKWNWWAATWFERWWVSSNIGVHELPPGSPVARREPPDPSAGALVG